MATINRPTSQGPDPNRVAIRIWESDERYTDVDFDRSSYKMLLAAWAKGLKGMASIPAGGRLVVYRAKHSSQEFCRPVKHDDLAAPEPVHCEVGNINRTRLGGEDEEKQGDEEVSHFFGIWVPAAPQMAANINGIRQPAKMMGMPKSAPMPVAQSRHPNRIAAPPAQMPHPKPKKPVPAPAAMAVPLTAPLASKPTTQRVDEQPYKVEHNHAEAQGSHCKRSPWRLSLHASRRICRTQYMVYPDWHRAGWRLRIDNIVGLPRSACT